SADPHLPRIPLSPPMPHPPRTPPPRPVRFPTTLTPRAPPCCCTRPSPSLPSRSIPTEPMSRGSRTRRSTPKTLGAAGYAARHADPGAAPLHLVAAKRARDPLGPEEVGGVHELEVQVGGRRVAGVAHPADHVPDGDAPAGGHRDRSGSEVGERGIDVARSDDHVVAEDRRQSRRTEGE